MQFIRYLVLIQIATSKTINLSQCFLNILNESLKKDVNYVTQTCSECEAELTIPDDALEGEIIECPDCGLDYVIEKNDNGELYLKELNLEGEDWGE